MKSLPIPAAKVRSNFSDVLDDARSGRRIRVTRHGKAVGWIIGAEERERLVRSQRGKTARRSRSGGR